MEDNFEDLDYLTVVPLQDNHIGVIVGTHEPERKWFIGLTTERARHLAKTIEAAAEESDNA